MFAFPLLPSIIQRKHPLHALINAIYWCNKGKGPFDGNKNHRTFKVVCKSSKMCSWNSLWANFMLRIFIIPPHLYTNTYTLWVCFSGCWSREAVCSFVILSCRMMHLDGCWSHSTVIMSHPLRCHRTNTRPPHSGILRFVMLAINQPVVQIDTNQPWSPSRTAWLPVSEMAGATHRVPSALHFISKCLYHLSACLPHSLENICGVGATLWIAKFDRFAALECFCGIRFDLKMFTLFTEGVSGSHFVITCKSHTTTKPAVYSSWCSSYSQSQFLLLMI